MTEEDKWLTVNSCEDKASLQAAILLVAENGLIESNRQIRSFDAKRQVMLAANVIEGRVPATRLTRNYGIRQQAIYIRYYEQLEKYDSIAGGPEPTDVADHGV